MIAPGETAPYAPKAAVVGVIRAYRNKPITVIDSSVVLKIGVSESIVPRTLQALRLLDLIDADGNPTTALADLRKAATEEDYKARLAEVIRAAYADVFTYRDPATDTTEEIEGAFRTGAYEPHGMLGRMVSLFRGLCAEAGIIEGDNLPRVSRLRSPRVAEQRPKRSPRQGGSGAPLSGSPIGPTGPGVQVTTVLAAREHMLVKGLLESLPPIGAPFTDEDRTQWLEAASSIFKLIYKRPSASTTLKGGNTD